MEECSNCDFNYPSTMLKGCVKCKWDTCPGCLINGLCKECIRKQNLDKKFAWNGKFNNYTDCQDGVYIWKLTLQPIQSFENQIFYGHVNLIR
jgi:hypothetical protein